MKLTTEVRQTKPYDDQKPGTSGLRKPCSIFLQPNYTENFVQSILNVVMKGIKPGDPFKIIIGGDGRYLAREFLVDIIVPMCAANDVTEIIIAQDSILSTPAGSHLIRKYKANGAILLTASHNPGGPTNDFGIKYNMQNGGPAPENITDHIFELSKTIKEYRLTNESMDLNIKEICSKYFEINGHPLKVTVVSGVTDYVALMKEIFDFNAIKKFLTGGDGHAPFKVVVDTLHGVTGPYAKNILIDEFGLDISSIRHLDSLQDFGGFHPDPNLTYASDLVDLITTDSSINFAAAFDGDGDRNMVLGRGGFFITPCDSLALIADNIDCIPYFKKGVSGFARSMPTSPAIDRVCKAKNFNIFEVPTGWKYFGNLMDANMCCVCGEESFGTGSNHIREKDGIWALLAWLSLLAARKAAGKSFEAENAVRDHWAKYGRDFFTRYDYEQCSVAEGEEIINRLKSMITKPSTIGREIYTRSGKSIKIKKMDSFSYVDPVDKIVSENQGYRIFFENNDRIVYRLSGTGSSGATLRIYVNCFSDEVSNHKFSSKIFLSNLVEIALSLCGVEQITGRIGPTVIT